MAAPTVHLLSSASFATVAISDAQSATIDESGTVQDYVAADSANVKLTAVDRIAATVSVVCLSYHASPAVGDTGALSLNVTPRAEGKGVTGAPVTVSWPNAVCTGKQGGPVIEGNPSYTLTFRAHAAP